MKFILTNTNKIIAIITIFAIIMGFGSCVFANCSFNYFDDDFVVYTDNFDISLPDFITSPDLRNYSGVIGSCFIYKEIQTNQGLKYIFSMLYYKTNNIESYDFGGSTYQFTCACIPSTNYFEPWFYSGSFGNDIKEIDGIKLHTGEQILFSSMDLVDNNGNVVFQAAPQEQEIPTITQTLVEQGTQAEMGETILATIKTFLIYLLIFVISIIAIWKAVRFLRSVLRIS